MTAKHSLFTEPAPAAKPLAPSGGTWTVARSHRPGVVAELTYIDGTLLRTLYIVTDAQVGDAVADAHLLAAAPKLRDACALVARCLDYGPADNPLLVAADRKRAEVLVRDALAAAVPPGGAR
jgi:hypothetical protein